VHEANGLAAWDTYLWQFSVILVAQLILFHITCGPFRFIMLLKISATCLEVPKAALLPHELVHDASISCLLETSPSHTCQEQRNAQDAWCILKAM